MPLNGFAWGTTFKFPAYISDYAFETTNNTGEDRFVRCTLPITLKGTLLMEDELRESTIKKVYSTKRITFKTETEAFDVNVSHPPPNGYTPQTAGDGFGTRKPFDGSTVTTEHGALPNSKNIRTIKGIRDLRNRPHADDTLD